MRQKALTKILILFITLAASAFADVATISQKWDYATYSNSLDKFRSGNIQSENAMSEYSSIIENSIPYATYIPPNDERLFVLLLGYRNDTFHGFLVLNKKTLKVLDFIAEDTNNQIQPRILSYNGKLLISWNIGGDNLEIITSIYDLKTLKLLYSKEKKFFRITKYSCLLDGQLFNGRLLNPLTGELISREGIPLKLMVYDCQNGFILSSLTKRSNEPMRLSLAQLTKKSIVQKIIDTNEVIYGLNLNEWHLSPNARYIVRDRFISKNEVNGRDGYVYIFDVQNMSSTKLNISDVNLQDSGGSGFTKDSKYYIFRSESTINFIDLASGSIAKIIDLPFRPNIVAID